MYLTEQCKHVLSCHPAHLENYLLCTSHAECCIVFDTVSQCEGSL
jgi:hypothetical protein